MLIDTHAHLNFFDFSDIEKAIKNAREAGVEKIINAGTSLEESKQVIDLAQKDDGLYATVGLHPNDNTAITAEKVDWAEFARLAKSPKVVGVGECGLDFSKLKTESYRSERAEKTRQTKLFVKQIEISKKLNLPLVIHLRDAQGEIMELFQDIDTQNLSGVFHCFSGSAEYLEFILLKLPNFYISFAGNITFKNAVELCRLVGQIPLTRILVETDSPYLSPEPCRGQRNEPQNIVWVAKKVAEIKNVEIRLVEEETTKNTKRLFF